MQYRIERALRILAAVAAGALLAQSHVTPAVASDASTGARLPPAPASAYHIHPGDQLNVATYNEAGLTLNATVAPDGTIALPLLGSVAVAGLSPTEAGAVIRKAALKYIRNPLVTVAVVSEGQIDILVLGNVKTPGKFKVRSEARVSDALAAAGGIAVSDGPYPIARVADGAGHVREANLEALVRGGDPSADVPMTDGGALYVPGPTSFAVEVIGAVDHAGPVQVNQGDGVTIAVAKAGTSINSGADLNSVVVRRPGASGQSTAYQIDIYKILNGQSNDDLLMQKGDVVYVPKARKGATGIDPLALMRRFVGLPF